VFESDDASPHSKPKRLGLEIYRKIGDPAIGNLCLNPPPNFSQVDFSIFQHYFSCRLKPMASEEALLDQFL
jgi:hypothetical protein